MIGKYRIITLCGSTRFRDEFIAEQKRLTLEGNIVISVGLFGHSGDDEVWSESTKEMLDDMHLRKIDLADEIFVINPSGYIGSSTKSEIEYARKPISPCTKSWIDCNWHNSKTAFTKPTMVPWQILNKPGYQIKHVLTMTAEDFLLNA
jgi:hypothetical protein